MTSLDRRDFLRLGLVPDRRPRSRLPDGGRGPLARSKLASMSRLNDWVGENILQSNTRLARVYPAGARSTAMPPTTSAVTCPPSRTHAGWALDIGGEVRAPASFTLEMLQQMPRITYTGQAPLCRGLDRRRHLDRRTVLCRGGDGPADRPCALRPVRLIRQRLLQRRGHGERDAPADHACLRLQ